MTYIREASPDELSHLLTTHHQWQWRKGLSTEDGGLIVFVKLDTVVVADPFGGTTYYSRPTKNGLQYSTSIRKPITELRVQLNSASSEGVMLHDLVRSPVVEEILIRQEDTEYQLTVFYPKGPIVYEGPNKGILIAQALYESFLLQSTPEGVRSEQEEHAD